MGSGRKERGNWMGERDVFEGGTDREREGEALVGVTIGR